MLTSILASFIPNIAKDLIGALTKPFELYLQEQITMEELQTQISKALLASLVAIEQAHAEALAKTFASFMDAVKQSPFMQWVWGSVVLSQLCVLLWHQAGIPALCFYLDDKNCYPSSGSTVEWAYLLVGALCGLGPMALRSGPGQYVAGGLKRLVGKG